MDINVKAEILKLFESLNGPEKAKRIYIDTLKERFCELKFLQVAADRSVNSDKT